MKYAQLVRRVQRVLRRESPYRHDDATIREIIELVIGRDPLVQRRRRKIIQRAVVIAMGASR